MPAPRKAGECRIEQLAVHAPVRAVNHAMGLGKYYVSADLLLRQVAEYKRIKDEEHEFILSMRFASLVMETIKKHQDFNKSDPRYTKLKKVLSEDVIPQMERLKVSIKLTADSAASRNRPANIVMLTTSNLPQMDWGSPPGFFSQQGFSSDTQVEDLLDIIANGSGPCSIPPPPPPPPQGQQGTPQSPPPPVYQSKYTARGGAHDDASRHALFAPAATSYASQGQAYPGFSHPVSTQGGQGLSYPGLAPVPRYPGLKSLQQGMQQTSLQRQDTGPQYPQQQQQQFQQPLYLPPSAGPTPGPQELGVVMVPQDAQGRPHTCQGGHTGTMEQQQPDSFTSSALVGGVKELTKRTVMRDVHVSVSLMEEFLAYARSNTMKNIESCGILAGVLSANDSTFTITALIIPKQQGTTDTVQALNEEEIFEVQFAQGLYPLGWIHTHPSQTCFLSSVDVHTQCGYQTMLEEAVAIVMAPTDRKSKCGIFRMTTPGGLQLVQKCPLRGFHPHPETVTGQELYELSTHVFLDAQVKHTVIDLR